MLSGNTTTPDAPPPGFLQDDHGTWSSMRLMCFTSLLAAMVFGLLTVLGKSGPDGVTITVAFLVGAFAPKAVQKFVEMRIP
jgi:hypothetical protein